MRKLTLLFIICICLWSSNCDAFWGRTWTWEEIGLAGLSIAAAYADAQTTEHNLDLGPGNTEMNPILGDRPNDRELAVYFSVSALLAIIAADYFDDYRVEILAGKTAINGSLAVRNYNETR